jgi:hypothetical protein
MVRIGGGLTTLAFWNAARISACMDSPTPDEEADLECVGHFYRLLQQGVTYECLFCDAEISRVNHPGLVIIVRPDFDAITSLPPGADIPMLFQSLCGTCSDIDHSDPRQAVAFQERLYAAFHELHPDIQFRSVSAPGTA